MNGKIRVSIVATSLNGSTVSSEPRRVLNIVNSSNTGNSLNENLFLKNNVEQNIVNSIDGANALKLDETFEIKNNEEQKALIESFESSEENILAEERVRDNSVNDEIPNGVSIENTSYMENFSQPNNEENQNNYYAYKNENFEEEYTPKLFQEEQNLDDIEKTNNKQDYQSEQLFDQEANEDEDFEIPAFLRRQKF